MRKFTQLFLILLVLPLLVSCQKMPGKPGKTSVNTGGVQSNKSQIIPGGNGELTTEDILQNRDISLYEQGGSISCLEWNPYKDLRNICDEKKVRDFLWKHWSEKRRGYLRIVRNTIDWWGTSHIFIEPKEKDTWHIAWRTVSASALPGGRGGVDDILDLTSVERIADTNGKPNDWFIVIKKASGEIFGQFPDKSNERPISHRSN